MKIALSLFTVCSIEPFRRPDYYVIYIRGYSLLRQCPPGEYYRPRLCRCVPRRRPIPTKTNRLPADNRTHRPLPTTFLPVTIEERPKFVTTVDPLVTNSFALMGGGFNMIQSPNSNVPENREVNSRRISSRRLLQHQSKIFKPFERTSTKSARKKNFKILTSSPFNRRARTKVQGKQEIVKPLKRVKISNGDEHHIDSTSKKDLYNHHSLTVDGNNTYPFFKFLSMCIFIV